MTQREKLLGAAVLVMAVAWGLSVGWTQYSDTLSERLTALYAAQDELDEAEFAANVRGPAAVEKMQAWQDRSLPTDQQQARSLYLPWLMETLDDAGLKYDGVELDLNTPRADAYDSIGYTVQASGRLRSVSDFLYEFYRSDQLHKVTQLRLRPEGDSGNLAVTIKLQALMVKGSTNDALSSGVSTRLALSSDREYQRSLTGRNIFAARAAERPQVARDAAEQTEVTTILGGEDPQVWLTDRETRRVMRLREGDRIRIRGYNGRIDEIRQREVVVLVDDKRMLIRAGKTLRQGTAL